MSSKPKQTPAVLKADGSKEMRKKTKEPAKPKTGNGMGCGPSQAVIIPSLSEGNSHLHPTVFMVGEQSFQMLRELGELKFYHLAQYNSDREETEDRHRDFAIHLENPLEYVKNETKSQSREKSQPDKPHEYRTNKLKAKRVATRVCRVDESVTTETQCSNDVLEAETSFCSNDLAISETRFYSAGSSSTSSPKSQTLTTRGLSCNSPSRNKCISEMLEDPTKFHGSSINMKDVTSTKSSHGAKTSPVQTPCTSETNQKTRTFFGRNRVSPKHSIVSDCPAKQTSNKERTAVDEQRNADKT